MATTEITPTTTESSPDPIKQQFEAWQKTVRPEPKPQESAPAAAPKEEIAAAPEVEGEQETASAPATESTSQEPKPRKNAESRIKELVSERNEWRDRFTSLENEVKKLREAKPEPVKAESQPAKTEKKARPNFLTWDKTPEEFQKAEDDWLKEHDQELLANARQLIAQEREQAELNAEYAEIKKQYPDFDTVALPFGQKLSAEGNPAVMQAVRQSDVRKHLLWYMSKDAKSADEIVALAKSNPIAAIKKIAWFEDQIRAELANPKEEKERNAEAEPETKKQSVPAPPETKASKPPSEVGGRAAAPPDALESASRRRDFKAFEQEATRRYLEKRK